MFADILPLYDCPFCSGDDGHVVLDLAALWRSRRRAPAAVYLDTDQLEGDQDLLWVLNGEEADEVDDMDDMDEGDDGEEGEAWRPCRHLLHAEGSVRCRSALVR